MLGDEFSLSQLKKAIDGLQDLGIEDSTGFVEGFNQAFGLIESISPNLMNATVHLGGTPSDAGLYTVVAVTANPNYETAFGVGYVTIKPDSEDVTLSFNSEIENGIISAESVSTFDFGVTALDKNGNPFDSDTVRIFYTGVTYEGDLCYGSDVPTQPGAYVQSAMVLGGNYFAAPISRAYAVQRYATTIVLDGFENGECSVTYTGNPVQLSATVSLASGEIVDDPEITWIYSGITNDGKLYLSGDAPAAAGKYEVLAHYMGDATKNISFVYGTLTIERADVVVTPAENNWIYDGAVKTFEFTSTPAGIDGFSVEYRADSAAEWTTEAPVNAGTYEVRVTRAEDGNLNAYEAVFPFVVDKATYPDIAENDISYESSSDGLTVVFPVSSSLYEWDDNPEFSSPEVVSGGVSTFDSLADPGSPFFVISQPGDYYFRIQGDGNHNPSQKPLPVSAARVTFDANGEGAVVNGSGSWMLPDGLSMGADLPSASRSGYAFEGWRMADGSVFDETTPVSGDVTVHAAWSVNPVADPSNPTADSSSGDNLVASETSSSSDDGSASLSPDTSDSPIALLLVGICVAAVVAVCAARLCIRRRN